MSTGDEHLYRGAPPPPPGPPPGPFGQPSQGYPGYGAPGSVPPRYGTPGYPPPGYGPPPGYPQQWVRPTNTMAILALVLAFVFPPAGLILGIIARKQIRRTGEDGDGLALAGIVVGSIAAAFYVLMILFMIFAFSIASSYAP